MRSDGDIGVVDLNRLIIAFACLHGLLYVSLLPLWEGYDEPYHYGYVRQLAGRGELPDLDHSSLTAEIWQSMVLAPTSHLHARNRPIFTSYTDYFRLPAAEREQRQRLLGALDPVLDDQPAGGSNYEAQQPPLAYLPLAAIDYWQDGHPVRGRVWRLRLVSTLAAIALLAAACLALGRRFGLKPAWMAAALLLLFSTQNLYGAVAHIANEWLAVPLLVIFLLAAEAFRADPKWRTAAWFALALAAGLLSKSYFLIFVPAAVILVGWRGRRHLPLFLLIVAALAGPWYARNVVLYHNLSGLQPAVAAVPRSAILRMATTINWPPAILGMARSALWTANSSFTTYSAFTLNVVLALLVVGAFLLFRLGRAVAPAAWTVTAGSLLFTAIPVYAMLLFGVMYSGAFPNANSWYSAGLLPGAFLLACAGFQSAGRTGRWLVRTLLVLSTLILASTYFAKLIPIYVGVEGAAKPALLARLYGPMRGDLLARLDQTALLPGWVVLLLVIATVVSGTALAWQVGRAVE